MRRPWLIQSDRRRAVVTTVLAMVAVVGAVATIVAWVGREESVAAVASDVRPPVTTASSPPPTVVVPVGPPTVAPTTTSTVPTPAPAAATTVPAPPIPNCRPVGELSVEQLAHLVVMVQVGGGDSARAMTLAAGPTPFGGLFIGGNDDRMMKDGVLSNLVAETHVLVAVDDEGGRVQRIDNLVGPMPSAAELGSRSNDDVRSLAVDRGRKLRGYGVTVDFAPVVDLVPAGTEGVIGNRSFGADPVVVTERAGAFADGLRSAGVIPTLKHFPGHGATSGDSHKDTVATEPWSALAGRDVEPYRRLAGPGSGETWVMMGHLDVPGLTDGLPASLSPDAHRYLRKSIGFDGLIVSDELGGMKAISSRFGPGPAAVKALGAGTDLVLFARVDHGQTAAQAIARAVNAGQVSPERLRDAAERVRKAQRC